jgi:hypothetical protein
MLPKVAQISSPASFFERRSNQRRVITLGFDAKETLRTTRILILNLSRTGLLLQTSADLKVGDQLEIEIPQAGLVNAKITRRTDDQFGAVFDAPIAQAAVSAVLLASPARPPVPLDQKDIGKAYPAYPKYDTVPGWLFWSVVTITSLVMGLFVYALGFLPVAG